MSLKNVRAAYRSFPSDANVNVSASRKRATSGDVPITSLRKAVFWAAFILIAGWVGVWGVLNNPLYKERIYGHLSLTELKREKDRYPDDPIFLYYFGKRLNETNQTTEAMTILEQAARYDNDSVRIRGEWAKAQIANGRLQDAYQQLAGFVQRHPASASGHLLLGKFYLSAGREDRGRTELEKAAQLDPTSSEIWYFLARARFASDPTAARAAIEKSVALDSKNADALLIRAVIYARRGTGTEVRAAFSQARALAPDRSDINQRYAAWLLTNLSEKGDVQLAEDCARRAALSEPGEGEAQLTYGRCCENGKPGEAIAPLYTAARTLPHDPFAARDLWRAYEAVGQKFVAEQTHRDYVARLASKTTVDHLLAELQARPQNAELRRELTRQYGRRGEAQNCLHHAALTLSAPMDSPNALRLAAADLSEGGFYAMALPFATRAAELAPDDGAAQETLADLLLRSGKAAEGMAAYEKAQELAPARAPLIRAKLQRLYAEKGARH